MKFNGRGNGEEFLFSVVMPVYNTQSYLGEAIESVINQSIGFSDNIQLILINDGSTDDSEDICIKYLKMYPDNIVYESRLTNLGIGAARNAGLKYVTGKYVTFLDSDDMWSEDAFKRVLEFFDKNYDDIDCVACRIKQFEASNKNLYLDYKFSEDRVVDIHEEYSAVQLRAASTFIKGDVAKSYSFNEKLVSGSDSLYITDILMRKARYGLLKSVVYHSRKRMDNTNSSLSYKEDRRYYTSDITEGMGELINNMDGGINPYIQYVLMAMIGVRLKEKDLPISESELAEYRDMISEVLKVIDDNIILEQRIIKSEFKLFALYLKYGDYFYDNIECNNKILTFNGHDIFSFRKKSILKVDVLDIQDGDLVLCGCSGIPFPKDNYRVYLKDREGTKYYCDDESIYSKGVESLGKVILSRSSFSVRIPVKLASKVVPYIMYCGNEYKLNMGFGQWAKLSNDLDKSYFVRGRMVVSKRDKALIVRKKENWKRYERKLLGEIFLKGKFSVFFKRIAVQVRRILKRRSGKEVWLFVDRVNSANENAEYLYDYVSSVGNDNIEIYYVLSKDSNDFERLSKKAHVLEYGTKKFINMYLKCDKYLTSQTTGFILKPTGIKHGYFKDLYPEFIYLQHGVMEKDLSSSQNKLAHNLRMFITSARKEYDSMSEYPYGYGEREVKLTGLARHDSVVSHNDGSGKKIIIAPTWRKNLSARINTNTGGRGYSSKFKESEFFKFYNNLMNDDRLLSKMRDNGYTGIFKPHPYMYEQSKDFNENDVFRVLIEHLPYKDQFNDCALLISDYSSIATDFAYAGYPVLYVQFDKDTFYQNHTYEKGFFDYEIDGFGPVCYDYESTVDMLISMIDSGFSVSDKYSNRCKNFFEFFDGKNCERIYNEVLNI